MDSEKKIEVDFQMTTNDNQRILVIVNWKRLVLVFGLLLIVPLIILSIQGISIFKDGVSVNKILTVFIPSLIGMVFIIYMLIFRAAKAMRKSNKPTRVIFSEQSIVTNQELGESKLAWEIYRKIYETDKYFIFFLIGKAFWGIPKRFFKDQDDIEALKELINRKLGDKAKLQN